MNTKRITALLLAVVLAAASLVSSRAESYLTSDGYYFWMQGEEAAAIHGCDSGKTELFFPVMLGGSFIVSIDDNAFLQNKAISSVEFAPLSHITQIGDGAFYGCTGIEEITLPQGLERVSESVFQDCGGLVSVTLGENTEAIDAQAFYNCAKLSSVSLPENLKSIGRLAFGNCPALTYLEVPRAVESIASSSFKNDQNLTLGVYYGSYAYSYAVDNGISYVLLDGVKLGDVSGDGIVNINDVTEIQRHLAKLVNLEGIYLLAANTNLDDAVDISDATALQKYIAEYELPYPIDEIITE